MKRHWLERPNTTRRLWGLLLALLALTVFIQVFVPIHGHFGIDETFGFHAWYGFAVSIAMVVVAKALGIFLKRRDSYYDE